MERYQRGSSSLFSVARLQFAFLLTIFLFSFFISIFMIFPFSSDRFFFSSFPLVSLTHLRKNIDERHRKGRSQDPRPGEELFGVRNHNQRVRNPDGLQETERNKKKQYFSETYKQFPPPYERDGLQCLQCLHRLSSTHESVSRSDRPVRFGPRTSSRSQVRTRPYLPRYGETP